MTTVSALKFRSEMGEMLDQVRIKREPVIITKHNKPIAMVVALELDKDTAMKRELPLDILKLNKRLAKIVGKGTKISLAKEKLVIEDYLRRNL